MPLVIRHPRADEDLSKFFDVEHCPLRWNLEQVYVADDKGTLVAIALVFDGGHDVVMVDFVRVFGRWNGKGVWVRLLQHITAALKAQGKLAVIGYVGGVHADAIVGMAQHYGAHIGTESYVALRKELA